MENVPVEADGNQFRNFQESFARRLADEAKKTSKEDKVIIKKNWDSLARKYYRELQPPQATKLIKIGKGAYTIALPITVEEGLMAQALNKWRLKRQRALDAVFGS